MKESKLKIIITLMTISVVGLIAIQIYWISNIVKVEEERFERTINTALIKAVDRLEKEEAANSVVKKFSPGGNNVLFFVQNDSDSNKSEYLLNKKSNLRILKLDSSHRGTFNYKVTYSGDSLKNNRKIEVVEKQVIHNPSPTSFNYTWNSKKDSTVIKRGQLVQKVVTELISENTTKKIEERISEALIDSLLDREFENSGISSDYFFGVKNINSDSLSLLKNGADTSLLQKSNLRTLLFPAELFYNPYQLIVYFPNKNSYLLASIAGMLSLSILLIGVISIIFYKTVQMFIAQKKITEIKNDLINNITHEFKTPISTIGIACEALNEPALTNNASAIGKYSSIIKEENERLKLMVENLLNTAAFEKGTYHLTKELLSLDTLVETATRNFDEILNQRNGKIFLKGIPSSINLNVDKFHILNILNNLIDNAIKYNENNPEIIVEVKSADGLAHISIEDNGIGIAKENISRIFDTFYRVSKGNIQNVRGNGIGLSYAKKIIEVHGGNISAQSDVNKGSIFTISIPIAQGLK